jgi:large subunit ribosomal protein L16
VASRGAELSFGEYGLKSLGRGWVSSSQLEAARRTVTHNLKKGGRVWVRVFPDKPISARAAGKRMGGGKGDVAKYVAVVIPGRILFEVAGAAKEYVLDAFAKAAAKLPVRTTVVQKEE